MSRILFRQIPRGSRLLAVGNFFRDNTPGSQWRLASILEQNKEIQSHRFSLEMACILGVGREFIAEETTPYQSHGFLKRLMLPPVSAWQERTLGECPRLSRRLARKPEVANQLCFVFEADGLTVWIPKFELARKLFFHAGFLVRAAFGPNGLDMVFSVQQEEDAIHIRTPAKTGAPSQLLKIKGYRDHFSWLLLDSDARQSFESIWQNLNKEQSQGDSRYARWRFNFIAPSSLSGTTIEVQGPLDSDRRELLVWEIKKLQGITFDCHDDIYFYHPSLRLSVKGKGGGRLPPASGDDEIEVDTEEEPNEDKERKLIELPIEGIVFDENPKTRIAYKSQRTNGHGKKLDDEQIPGGNSKILGMADDVAGGILAPGEFQQLERHNDKDLYPDRFIMLREIIKQLAEEPGIELLELDVKPLPQVPRCSCHMMDHVTPRCYLMARFRLRGAYEKVLLEIDISDSKRRMSTRIFCANWLKDVGVEKVIKFVVKQSLKWPSVKSNCLSVNHPTDRQISKESSSWKARLVTALVSCE